MRKPWIRYSLIVICLGTLCTLLVSASPTAMYGETVSTLTESNGIRAQSAEGLARLAPVPVRRPHVARSKGPIEVGSEEFALRLDPDAPKRIEVNVRTQRVIAWQGDQQVFEFAATTGDEGSPTVLGQYLILDKIEQDAYSELWGMTMPFWMGIYYAGEWEDGFHGVPTLDNGEQVWGDALGQHPATHGCIVTSPADAKALFDWAEVGTTVDVHE